VLPGAARLTRSQEFSTAVRAGRRAGRPLLVVHLRIDPASIEPSRVGFVTTKAVGSAVVRNRVRRRLRHLMAARLTALPTGSLVVVRATPAAAAATSSALADDLDRALSRLAVPR
jgi:ribonuclease P protein component